MKKIIKFILPLMVIPFLASCGEKDSADYKVTKEEHDKAISLDGIDYMQSKTTESEETDDEEIIKGGYIEKFSPNVYSCDGFKVNGKEEIITDNEVMKKTEEGCEVYERKSGEEWTKYTEDVSYFVAPNRSNAFDTIKSSYLITGYVAGEKGPLPFEELKFNDKTKMYVFEKEFSPENGDKATVELKVKFKNKKLTELHYVLDDGTETGGYDITFEYEEITPDIPVVE